MNSLWYFARFSHQLFPSHHYIAYATIQFMGTDSEQIWVKWAKMVIFPVINWTELVPFMGLSVIWYTVLGTGSITKKRQVTSHLFARAIRVASRIHFRLSIHSLLCCCYMIAWKICMVYIFFKSILIFPMLLKWNPKCLWQDEIYHILKLPCTVWFLWTSTKTPNISWIVL